MNTYRPARTILLTITIYLGRSSTEPSIGRGTAEDAVAKIGIHSLLFRSYAPDG